MARANDPKFINKEFKNKSKNVNEHKNYFHNYRQMFSFIYNNYSEFPEANQRLIIEDYLNVLFYLERQTINRGILDTISLIKFMRVVVYKYVSSDLVPTRLFFKTYKDGLPRALGPRIAALIRSGDKHTIQMILTLFQVSYQMDACKEPQLESIVSPSTADESIFMEFEEWYKDYHNKFITVKVKSYWNAPHETSKAGPIGPAVWSIPYEAPLISDKLMKNLKIIGGPKYGDWLDSCITSKSYLQRFQDIMYEGNHPKMRNTRESLRRITFVKAPEGKARVIAILDWWSQTVLKPIHDWSFDQLRKIPNDMTFNQGGFRKVLPKDGPYYSFDLSSATDRFPVRIQLTFMKHLIGQARADAWHEILNGEPFLVDWTKEYVKYSTGQPMGAYSSWSIFSLCHHLIVQFAAHRAGITGRFADYCVLGDDIVIANSAVATSYKSVISRLGVGIDLSKSLVSKDSFEFAKRFVHKGVEMTAFPLSAMIDNRESCEALWATTITARERGYDLSSQSIPGFVADIQCLLNVGRRLTRRKVKDLEAMHVLQRGEDNENDLWALQHIAHSTAFPVSCHWSYKTLKAKLLSSLALGFMKYKASQLEMQFRKFHHLTERLNEGPFITSSLEGLASQSTAPIDAMRIPIVWVMANIVKTSENEMQQLMSLRQRNAYIELIRYKVNLPGEMTRVVSHRANLPLLARQSRLFRFLRREQVKFNELSNQALGDEPNAEIDQLARRSSNF